MVDQILPKHWKNAPDNESYLYHIKFNSWRYNSTTNKIFQTSALYSSESERKYILIDAIKYYKILGYLLGTS